MEALKQSMADILKDNNEDSKPSWFGCETCHIWQKEVNTLQVKLDKALQLKVTFALDTSKYKMPSNNPYRMYSLVEKSSNRKITYSHNLYCHYCCKKGHTITK